MRILTFSDWRVQSIESLFNVIEGSEEPVDMILYAGDDVSRFQEADQNIFAEMAAETTQEQVLAVVGNDDIPSARQVLDAPGVHDLHHEPFVYDDYVFLGLEGAVEGGPGMILYSEEEIQEHLRQQYSGHEDKIPVLVSHVPPKGILDIGLRFGQQHIGSESVRSFIEEVEPVLTVCGHCHQFGGRAKERSFGTVINIASHDDPNAKGRYGIVDLNGRDLAYTLTTTEAGADHHLLQLSQVGSSRLEHFREAGITELSQINEENRRKLEELPGSSEWHTDMWIEEAKAIRNGELAVRDREEFELLEDDDVVLVDIETDLSQSHIWLIGLYSYQTGEFDQIFEKDDEEKLLNSFSDYLRQHDNPTIVYYGGNYFDATCLKQRLEAHGLEEAVALMKQSLDLGITVQNNLLGAFRKTKLDNLAGKIADYDYKYPELDGFLVGSKYTGYLLDGEEPNWDKLLDYNKDDVLALKVVVDTIRSLLERKTERQRGKH